MKLACDCDNHELVDCFISQEGFEFKPYIFQNATSLTRINIPDAFTVIPNSAFRNCSSLIAVSIPSFVTSFRNDVFFEYSRLKQKV